MKANPNFMEWEASWGSPRALFEPTNRRMLEAAFVAAIFLHAAPLGLLWKKQTEKKAVEIVTLQDVDFIEPEVEEPPPQPVEVQKPKSALDFIKMALPVFRKQEAPEIPRDIVPLPKAQEPKIAEPERLVERKMAAQSAAPEIKLDASKNMPPPKIAEIAKLPNAQRAELNAREPALKLEEVGQKAAPPSALPALRLDASRAPEKAADLAALPKTRLTARAPAAAEKIADRSVSYAKPVTASPALSYEKRASLSLEGAREPVRAQPRPDLEKPAAASKPKQEPASIQISKERVKITGPLSSRKVIRSSIPDYPDWAKAKNIEADVAIRFTVSAAGDVTGTVVERTSGYVALDKSSIDELKKWKFSPLAAGGQDQWGVITFRFLLQ